MVFERLLEELKKLNLPKDKYIIFGSGPMAIRGIRDSEDIDVLVTKALFEELLIKFPQDISNHPLGMMSIGDIEIGSSWQGNKSMTNKIIGDAEFIQGFPFARLGRVIKWKKDMGREKDKRDLKLIEEYLTKNR